MTAGLQQIAPLAGVRVVGIEHSVAAPLCTRVLAELGADVIKVEREGQGDFARTWDRNVSGESAQFWWLNRGKRSVTLNFRREDDRKRLDDLLAGADVAVYNMSPPAADRLGLTDPDLVERFPRLVLCQISGYGNTPSRFRDRKAYDMLIQAEAGIMSLTGTAEAPARVGVSICDVSTGLYAVILVLAALRSRDATGRGTRLDVSMMDSAIEFVGPMLMSYLNAGVTYERFAASHHAVAPYGVFSCRDGSRLLLAVENQAEWQEFCAVVLEDAELAERPEFATNSARVAHLEDLTAAVQQKMHVMGIEDAIARLEQARIAYANLNDVPSVAVHPVVEARSIIEDALTRDGDPVHALRGLAERTFGTHSVRRRPPSLGEDNAADLNAESLEPAGEKA
jgi:itaconate CoA-transferase